MFTEAQIKEAHGKVRSGADFPAYISDLRELGVHAYETYVADGHTDFYGGNGYLLRSEAKYQPLRIAPASLPEQFKADLKAHQTGQTDYPTFCSDCAKSGIEKWSVSLEKMTCTYWDQSGNEVLTEAIPG